MNFEPRPGRSKGSDMRKRLSHHAWVVIFLLVIALFLALCSRPIAAQASAVEIVEKAQVQMQMADPNEGDAVDAAGFARKIARTEPLIGAKG